MLRASRRASTPLDAAQMATSNPKVRKPLWRWVRTSTMEGDRVSATSLGAKRMRKTTSALAASSPPTSALRAARKMSRGNRAAGPGRPPGRARPPVERRVASRGSGFRGGLDGPREDAAERQRQPLDEGFVFFAATDQRSVAQRPQQLAAGARDPALDRS